MDFTNLIAFGLALISSLAISIATALGAFAIRKTPPSYYRRVVIILVGAAVMYLSMNWENWRLIFLTRLGLFDLAFILAFTIAGALLGTIPLAFLRKKKFPG